MQCPYCHAKGRFTDRIVSSTIPTFRKETKRYSNSRDTRRVWECTGCSRQFVTINGAARDIARE
jgi:hypothetical protein